MNELTSYLLGSVGVKTANVAAPAMPQMPQMPQTVTPHAPANVSSRNRGLQELGMWQTWKDGGYKEQHLQPLMTSLEPAITFHVNKWKAANVPDHLIKIRAKQITVDSLKSYTPTAGHKGKVASPGSWVQQNLNQLQRFIVTNQNVGRIQENRAGKNKRIFDEARQYLREIYSREPTIKEIAEDMTTKLGKSITEKQVRMYVREERRDNTVSDENFVYTPTATRMLLKLLPEELTPLENQVFERLYGLNGIRVMKPGEIALDLRIDGSRVSRIRNKIREKASEYQ
jgi:hypothetical protein